ncbi:MAG TPA: M23 family metallopeptidase, partial [Chitinophagales bacterium]|nr:M23 family metallopeptidase [Chitinophagales bacterium]
MHKETLMQMASFTSPLDGKLYISGTFGEPRPNHYHSGLDFKTNQEIGKKVYAADAGYISRIKVSAYGYGHALYMNHPSNLTTVYAHLDEFSEPIKQWVKSIQYELQSFEIDTVLKEKLFLFEKGDQIALSGNSGGSAGPHLHFELRNTYSEVAINPMAFLKVEDQTPPTINQLRIYPIQNSFFDHKGIPVRLKPTSKNSWSGGFVEVPEGEIILSLQAFDQQDLTLNKNGIPTVKMFVNGQLVFLRQKDSINFSE